MLGYLLRVQRQEEWFDLFHQILNKRNKCVPRWVRLYLYSDCGATADKK